MNTESVCRRARRAGKRHVLVDTDGRALLIEPHPADIQDRDGGGPLLQVSCALFPFIKLVWAGDGYNHERVTETTSISVEIVRKQPDQVGFVVLPRCWVVERFFAFVKMYAIPTILVALIAIGVALAFCRRRRML